MYVMNICALTPPAHLRLVLGAVSASGNGHHSQGDGSRCNVASPIHSLMCGMLYTGNHGNYLYIRMPVGVLGPKYFTTIMWFIVASETVKHFM